MQLISKSNLKPLKIALGVAAGSALLYGDFDRYSNIRTILSDSRASEYVSYVNDPNDALISTRNRFASLYNAWREKTMFSSSVKAITECREFKEIVSMGDDVVDLILDKIEIEPSHIVWALNCIYQRKISSNPNTTISEACKLWIKELRH